MSYSRELERLAEDGQHCSLSANAVSLQPGQHVALPPKRVHCGVCARAPLPASGLQWPRDLRGGALSVHGALLARCRLQRAGLRPLQL